MGLIQEIKPCLSRLFPIAGRGDREPLRVLQEIVLLNILEYPSGTSVHDWIVPMEWKVRSAFIKNSCGELMVDFWQNNLHVVGFSQAAHQKMGLDDLESHLHYLPDIPEDTILQWSDIID